MTVVGIPIRATWRDLWTDMPVAWDTFVGRHVEIAHRVGRTFIDASLEQNGDEYVQLVCSEVSQLERIPEGM